METRIERLKTLFSVSTITPLPQRPGIRFDEHNDSAATIASCMAMRSSAAEIQFES